MAKAPKVGVAAIFLSMIVSTQEVTKRKPCEYKVNITKFLDENHVIWTSRTTETTLIFNVDGIINKTKREVYVSRMRKESSISFQMGLLIGTFVDSSCSRAPAGMLVAHPGSVEPFRLEVLHFQAYDNSCGVFKTILLSPTEGYANRTCELREKRNIHRPFSSQECLRAYRNICC